MIYNVSEDGYNMGKNIYIYTHTVICGGEKFRHRENKYKVWKKIKG